MQQEEVCRTHRWIGATAAAAQATAARCEVTAPSGEVSTLESVSVIGSEDFHD